MAIAISHVVLDVVGTVLRPRESVSSTYCEFGQQHGSQLEQAIVKRNFSLAFNQVFKETGSASQPTSHSRQMDQWRHVVSRVFTDLQETESLFQALWQHYARPAAWKLFADVEPAWKQLQAAGNRICLASNFDDRLLDIVSQIQPLDSADAVFCSSQVGFEKPDLQFFLYVQDQLGSPPHEIIMVGDSPENDYEGPLQAGWQARLIDRRAALPTATTITDLRQLAEHLTSAN